MAERRCYSQASKMWLTNWLPAETVQSLCASLENISHIAHTDSATYSQGFKK